MIYATILRRLWPVLTAALICLAAWAGWTRYTAMRTDLAAAQALIATYAEAAEIRRKSDETQARLRDEAAAIDHELEHMEGADAPLSDYLRSGAGRVWR